MKVDTSDGAALAVRKLSVVNPCDGTVRSRQAVCKPVAALTDDDCGRTVSEAGG